LLGESKRVEEAEWKLLELRPSLLKLLNLRASLLKLLNLRASLLKLLKLRPSLLKLLKLSKTFLKLLKSSTLLELQFTGLQAATDSHQPPLPHYSSLPIPT
jgi:uncharacterized membrane protein